MILPVIENRRSVREFAAREVPEESLRELLRAAQYAPTGMNNRAVEFLVLRDRVSKQRLFDRLEPKQPFVKEAPLLIVPATNLDKIPIPEPDRTIVAVADLSIASAFIMAQAVELGLGTVWKHVAADFVPGVVEAFGLPPGFFLTNVIPVGYPARPLPAHQEAEFSPARIHGERW